MKNILWSLLGLAMLGALITVAMWLGGCLLNAAFGAIVAIYVLIRHGIPAAFRRIFHIKQRMPERWPAYTIADAERDEALSEEAEIDSQ